MYTVRLAVVSDLFTLYLIFLNMCIIVMVVVYASSVVSEVDRCVCDSCS